MAEEEEDFYILPYYFDDEGVLKSRVKVGDYITIESDGISSQKQVLEVKILKSERVGEFLLFCYTA